MTTYFDTAISLSPYQKSKIATAVRNNVGTSIQLSNADLSGPNKIRLTQQQITRIKKAKSKGAGIVLKLSKTQFTKQGGFLGALLGGLAASLLPQLLGMGMTLPGTPISGRGKKKASKRSDVAPIRRTLAPLTGSDIDKIMRNYVISNFRGTFSKDMLPKDRKQDESLVVNLEDYFSGGGTHWVVLVGVGLTHYEYFDSFGLPPPLEVVRYVGGSYIKYNSSQIQDMNSIMCGYYCCYYIVERCRGRKPIDILLDFNLKPTAYNETWIRQFARIASEKNAKQNASQAPNNIRRREMMKCKCESCGITKTQFVTDKEGSGLDIHKAIGKIPHGKHGFTLPGHRYTGPYNDLSQQLTHDSAGNILQVFDKPKGRNDAVSMQHDVDYSVCGDDVACKNRADKKMVTALDEIPWGSRQWGHALARNAIATKAKLGLGK